jgi:hypothetical protein
MPYKEITKLRKNDKDFRPNPNVSDLEMPRKKNNHFYSGRKVKLSLCLINELIKHHAMKTYREAEV